jgi:predicted DNA-binding transcriptional regulator AlpA
MDTTLDRGEVTAPPNSPALYAQPDILARGKFSKSTLYNLIARGDFPKPCLVLGPRFTRWSALEVDAWLKSPQSWIEQHATTKSQALYAQPDILARGKFSKSPQSGIEPHAIEAKGA